MGPECRPGRADGWAFPGPCLGQRRGRGDVPGLRADRTLLRSACSSRGRFPGGVSLAADFNSISVGYCRCDGIRSDTVRISW